MHFIEFARARWGPDWALCRKIPTNLARYACCVSQSEYRATKAAYRRQHTADALRDPLMQLYLGDLTADLYEALDRTEKILHHAVNGGLNTAKRRATVGDLKAVMRQVRDEAREAVAKAKEN